MLLCLTAVVVELEAWAEACPCHRSEDLQEFHGSWYRRSKAFQQESKLAGDAERGVVGMQAQGEANRRNCPCRGCRCPELAAGKVFELLEKMCSVAMSELLILTNGLQQVVCVRLKILTPCPPFD